MGRRRAATLVAVLAAALALVVFFRNRGPPDAEGDSEELSGPPAAGRPRTAAGLDRDRWSASPIQLNRAGSSDDASAKAGEFEGRVISSASGLGIPDAEITFQYLKGAISVRSDAAGRFRLEATDVGTYRLAAVVASGYLPFAPEWGRSPVALTARAHERIRDIVLMLSPAVEYLGVVLNPNGERVQGAQVTMLNGGQGEMALMPLRDSFSSDANGEFRFVAPTGAWLQASHPQFSPGRAQVTLAVQGSRRIELSLSAKSDPSPREVLAGRVVDPQDGPIAGASVMAFRRGRGPDADDGFRPEVTTDADGAFAMEGLLPGFYDVIATHPGFASARARRIEAGTRSLTLRLSTGARVRGTVRDHSTKAPVVAFTVSIQRVLGPLARNPVQTVAIMDAEGRYEISGVPLGTHAAIAAGDGFAPSGESTFTVSDASEEKTIDFELNRGAELSGTVVDRQTGRPIAGAQVSIEGQLSATSVLSVLTSSIADPAGRFELRGLSAGPGSVLFTAEKHHSRMIAGLNFEEGSRLGPLRVELEPAAEGEEPHLEMEGIGAVLAVSRDVLVITRLLPGGGATQAGLTVGDEILSVDGRPVTELGFNGSIQRIRGPEGSCIPLTIRKNESLVADVRVCRTRVRGS